MSITKSSKNLRLLRLKQYLTQAELAKRTGINRSRISLAEHEFQLTREELERIKKVRSVVNSGHQKIHAASRFS